jgi:PAS domain S-box-containing protein
MSALLTSLLDFSRAAGSGRPTLAPAGLGQPDHVSTGEERRDRVGLDRRGRLVADVTQDGQDLWMELQVVETRRGRGFRRLIGHRPRVVTGCTVRATGRSQLPGRLPISQITERAPTYRRGMSELEEAEERWRLTIDNAPVGIALVDMDGRFLRVNETLCRTLGYEPEHLIQLTFQELTHADDLDRDLELRDALVSGQIPRYRLRKRYRRADGDHVWADLFVSLARDASGRPLHFISYVEDVSEQVEVAERIQRMNQDLLEQKSRLERSNDDLEAFATLASHDLQAPLGTVRGYLELLGAEYGDVLGPQGTRWVARASEATQRMSALLTSLLDFSRAAGSGRPTLAPAGLGALLDGVMADLADLLSRTGTTVRLVGPSIEMLVDTARLRQVLQNLVQNAVKYHHPDRPPVVEVSATELDDRWQVVVADNGVGVPPEDRERVFRMVQQAGRTESGYGVGLAVSRRVVERHGGHIWIEDNPGGGSRFCFTIPQPTPTHH